MQRRETEVGQPDLWRSPAYLATALQLSAAAILPLTKT